MTAEGQGRRLGRTGGDSQAGQRLQKTGGRPGGFEKTAWDMEVMYNQRRLAVS